MQQVVAKSLVFVALIAAVAAPRPVMACHGGTEFNSCCQSTAATPHGCCQKTATSFNCSTADHNCVCHRPADPRDSSTSRPADLVARSTALAILTSAPIALANFYTSADQPEPPHSGQAAIPHRILHCSWLI